MDPVTLTPATDAVPPYALIDQTSLDLTRGACGQLELSFSPSVWDADLFLVIDLYSAVNPVHPEGHIGWWKWPLETKGDLSVQIARGDHGYSVTFDGALPQESWTNADFLGVDEPVVALHVVLRPVVSEAVRFDDTLCLYNSSRALDEAVSAQRKLTDPALPPISAPWYVWPRQTTVHLVATNIYPRDAVGNFALGMFRLLRSNGMNGQLYASNFDPRLRGPIRSTCELFDAVGRDDVLFLNFSIYDPWLPRIAQLHCKKVFYFHNITPPRFLQVYDAEYADHCADGIAQLKHLDQFDVLMANSATSASVLQNLQRSLTKEGHSTPIAFSGPFEEASRLLQQAVQAIEAQARQPRAVVTSPPLVGVKDWNESRAEPVEMPREKTLLLYVGRIAPHKRIEDLFALFDCYHKLNSDSALVIVGGAQLGGYAGFLRYLLDKEYARVKRHIHFYSDVSDAQLKTIYERSSAMVTMSEHEGFCVPVVEAMAMDKPVFAYADPAVIETLGHSGRVFYAKDFQTVAADIDSVLSKPWLHERIVDAQRTRLAQIAAQANGETLWAVLEKVVYGARAV